MIENEVIREVRAAREQFARLHGFNIRAMVADLQAQDLAGDWPVVSRPARSPQMPNPSYPSGRQTTRDTTTLEDLSVLARLREEDE